MEARPPPPPDDYTVALHKALMFFNVQRCEPAALFLHFCSVRDFAFPWAKCLCFPSFSMSPAITLVIR
jgi:hypothetical protein